MTQSQLFINETPLQILPALIKAVGLSEAIILQEIHLLKQRGSSHSSATYGSAITLKQLHERFFFLNAQDIKEALTHLERSGILLVSAVGEGVSQDCAINYKLVKSLSNRSQKFVSTPLKSVNRNRQFGFTAKVSYISPGRYVIKARRASLSCKMLLEVKPELNKGTVSCRLPPPDNRKLFKRLQDNMLIYRAIMLMFQIRLVDELFRFCKDQGLTTVVLDRTNDLGMIRDFMKHLNPTHVSDKPKVTIQINAVVLANWGVFAARVMQSLKQSLWRVYKDNPRVKELLARYFDLR